MAFHVDDYQIRWQNYRPFRDTGWITIRPLTILLGPNNAGKTSVFSPLLVMAQTVMSPDSETPLITKEELVDLGGFRDLVRNNFTKQNVVLGLKFHLHQQSGKAGKIGAEPPGVIEATFGVGSHPEEPVLKKVKISDAFSRPMFTRTRRGSGFQLSSKFLRPMHKIERELVREERPYNFLFTPTTALSRARGKRTQELASSKYSEGFSTYLSAVGFATSELVRFFGRLTYVGPLRERPKRFYEVSGAIPSSVGVRGEDMANMIRRRWKQIRAPLNKWVRRFEFGSSISLSSNRTGEFSLFFKLGSRKMNIADAGFGTSQVLPLIVQAIVAPENTLTIAEQPEIHLNPKLQSTLADLFVEMANSDHRVIVETHSEHLLLRLRRLVAKGTIKNSKVAIYYIERVGDESKIREIRLEGNGSVRANDWPAGFFDDSLKESLSLAQDQYSATRRRSQHSTRSA